VKQHTTLYLAKQHTMKEQSQTTMQIRDKSAPFDDEEGIKRAFEEDGYCVVTGILSDAQTETMLDELWTSERLLGKFDRDDPSTWASDEWPQSAGSRGFLSSSNVFQDRASWELASNERLLRVQQLLYGRQDIMMENMGRFGVMRPTAHHPEWKTESSWLHWDQNCWTEPDFCRVQCIVCLTDNTATSGGFACVPGFHKGFKEWGEQHPMGSLVVGGKVIDESFGCGQPFPVPTDDPCQEEVCKILAPAGSAVIWDSRLPHQNFYNTDDQAFRVVHYSMMQVRSDRAIKERRRLLNQKRIVMDILGQEGPIFPHNMTATGRWVHGLEEKEPSLEEALQEFGVDDVDSLRQAVIFVREAGEMEEKGDIAGAIRKHQQSMRLVPDIEEWHNAIF